MLEFGALKQSGSDSLHIIPFGGCGEFGMNLTVYIHDGQVIVVDCGIMFPDPMKLGVDAIFPNVDPWLEQLGGVSAYLITHAHEDHLGALAHVVQKWPAPIYMTAWTRAVFNNKLSNLSMDPEKLSVTTVRPGDRTVCGAVDAEWVHLNHSIPMSCGLFLRTKAGNVFHTGDFKIDLNSHYEVAADVQRLEQLGREGVDLLLADSTNALAKGICPGESEVAPTLEKMLLEAPGKVFVTTFASNYWRACTIIDICEKIGKRVVFAGRGMLSSLEYAKQSGLNLHERAALVADEDAASSVEADKLVVLTTGSQGESNAALARIAYGEHKRFRLEPRDTVIYSSRTIPGNEKPVLDIINRCLKAEAQVITWRQNPLVHVSGHGYSGELELMMEKLRPKNFIPVHGTHQHLLEHLRIAHARGIGPNQSLLVENGHVIAFSQRDGLQKVGEINIERTYIDGMSKATMTHETMRGRLRIGELGGALVYGVIDKERDDWAVPPKVELIGLPLPHEIPLEPWLELAAEGVAEQVQLALQQGSVTHEQLSEVARVTLRRYLSATLGKKPVVMAKVLVL